MEWTMSGAEADARAAALAGAKVATPLPAPPQGAGGTLSEPDVGAALAGCWWELISIHGRALDAALGAGDWHGVVEHAHRLSEDAANLAELGREMI